MKIVRVLVYEGDDTWIERTLQFSAVRPSKPYRAGVDMQVRELFRGSLEELGKAWEENAALKELLP